MQYWFLRSPYKHHTWASIVLKNEYLLYGIRSFATSKAITQMKLGDLVIFYSSPEGKKIFGIMKVISEPFNDPGSRDDRFKAIRMVPVKAFKKPLLLSSLKDKLPNHLIFKQARISVVSLTNKEYEIILVNCIKNND